MRVEPGQPQRRGRHRGGRARRRLPQRPGPQRRAERGQGEGEQVGHTAPAQRLQRPGGRAGQHADRAGAGGDEDQVAQRADGDDEPDVLAPHALAQHPGVLGADGDDESEPGAEAGQGGGRARQGGCERCCHHECEPRVAPV